MDSEDYISICKFKIWKGRSFVLKTSLLKEAFAEANTSIETQLYYDPKDEGCIFSATYHLPRAYISSNIHLCMHAGSVLSEQRKNAYDALIEKVMPAFVDWLITTLKIPEDSNAIGMEPYFGAYWKNEKLEVKMGFRNQRNQ